MGECFFAKWNWLYEITWELSFPALVLDLEKKPEQVPATCVATTVTTTSADLAICERHGADLYRILAVHDPVFLEVLLYEPCTLGTKWGEGIL